MRSGEKEIKIKIVTPPYDYVNYEYALCECTNGLDAIQVPRKKENYMACFACPRCKTRLGVWVRGYGERGRKRYEL